MTKQNGMRFLFLTLLAMTVSASTARANFLGTLQDNSCIKYTASSGEIVFFCDADIRPTGTGYFDPFLRVQKDGTSGQPKDTTPLGYTSGFNTDADFKSPSPGVNGYNDMDPSWTSSLPAGDIRMTNSVPTGAWNPGGSAGSSYALFTVDINQSASEGSDILTLNQMLLYNCATNNYTSLSQCSGGSSFFNLFGNTGDFINFDYRLHTGSGSGDVDVYIQNNAGFTGPYISLLDGWGCGTGSTIPAAYSCSTPNIAKDNDGFQEWATTLTPGTTTPTVPEPASLLLLGSGLSAAGVVARRRRAQKKSEE